MQNNTGTQMRDEVYAGFFVRLSAYLIDWLLVGAALLVIRIPVWIASLGGAADFVLRDFIFQYSVYDIVLYLLKVTYFVLLTYFTGSTLGKKLLQIRVVSAENRKLSFFEIVFRESVGKFLSSIVLYVGYIMIGADKEKRGLHDILSDTYVVYDHRKTVAVPAPITYNTVQYTGSMPHVPPYQAGAARGDRNTAQTMPPQGMAPGNNPMVPPQGMAPGNNPMVPPQGMVLGNRPVVPPQGMAPGDNPMVPPQGMAPGNRPMVPPQHMEQDKFQNLPNNLQKNKQEPSEHNQEEQDK